MRVIILEAIGVLVTPPESLLATFSVTQPASLSVVGLLGRVAGGEGIGVGGAEMSFQYCSDPTGTTAILLATLSVTQPASLSAMVVVGLLGRDAGGVDIGVGGAEMSFQ